MTQNISIDDDENDRPQGYIKNCKLIARGDVDYLFSSTDSGLRVQLDGYLICPKEMFTERQIEDAHRKWFKTTEWGKKSEEERRVAIMAYSAAILAERDADEDKP